MKQLLCIFFAVALFGYNATAQITFRGCTNALSAQDYILSATGTTTDAGTVRNTYESTPSNFAQSCAAGVCEVRIIWSTATSRWEVQLDNDGPLGAPDYTTSCLYFNTSPSFPNPPDLSLGSWQDCSGGNCPVNQFVTMSGDVQSSVSSCSNPTVPTITASPTTICAGNTLTLTISGTLNDATNWHVYTGSCGGTQVGTTSGSSLVVTPSASNTTYFVRGEDGAGCVDEATGACGSVTVTVNPIPATPIITANGPTTFCTGGSVNLVSNASPGNQWFLNGNPIAGATNQSLAVTATGNYSVEVTTNGCVSSTSAMTVVTVNPIPATPAITANGPTTFCVGGSVNLTSSASTGNQWFLNGSPIGGATSQNLLATTAGNYTVEVTTNGCVSSASSMIVVTVNPTPATPTITANGPTTFCTGGSVNLVSSASAGNQWFLNGSAIGSANGQTFVATTNGNYTVTSTVNGCASSTSSATVVTVNPIPNAPSISTPSTTTICNGIPVTLTSTISTGNQWFLNGSAISGANGQNFSATTGGNYTVTNTVNGCTSSASGIVIITESTIAPVASASSSTICAGGGSVTLTSSISTGNQWFVGGTPIIGATNQTLVATAGGLYLTEVTDNGCTANSNAVTINVTPTPATPTITANGPTTFCTGGSVSLASSASTGNQWFLNGSTITGETNQNLVVTATGNYTVQVTANGCVSSVSAATTVTVNQNGITPAITANGSTIFCAGGSVILSTTTSTGNQWFLNGSAIAGETNQSLVATAAGNYMVELTVNGCSNTSPVIVVTVSNPVTTSQTFVECAGSSITAGGNTYTTSGVYIDTLAGANGCDSIITTNLTILAPIGSTINQTLCAGESTTIGGIVYNTTTVGATQAYTSASGCDSVVTINVNVLNPVDTTITATLPTLTANSSTASYQWVNCDSSYMPLAGETAQAYTPTANGNYAVIITEGNCLDTSSCYAVIITGIKNNKLTRMLSLFPNPTSGNLTIELGQAFNEVTIKVTNIAGQHISTELFKSTDTIDLSIDGVKGVYLLEIRTDEGDVSTIKVLKK